MRKEMTAQALAALPLPHTPVFRCEVWRGGTRYDVDLQAGLPVLGGEVRIDSTAKIRRQVSLTTRATDEIWNMLATPGAELRPYRGLQFVNNFVSGATIWVPLGRFEVDQPTIGYAPRGQLQVSGNDYRAKLEASGFVKPAITQFGTLITSQITTFLQQALPDVPLQNSVTSTYYIGSKVYEEDRAAALDEMTTAIGAELLFDGDGTAVLRPVPQISATPVWTVAAGQGVMLDASRQTNLSTVRNVVVVSSAATDGKPLFDPVVVADNTDPTSPTYAGPDPVNSPAGAAAFGVRVDRLSSTAITDPIQARAAGVARLAQVAGRPSTLTLQTAVNPGLEDGDTITVVLPPDPVTGRRPVEAHLVQSVTIPLTVTEPQQITTRARSVTA